MASPLRRLFSGWAPPIMRDRPLPTRRHLGLPGTGSRPRMSRPGATSSSSSMGHHICFLHGGRERQALLGHRHLSARRRKLPRGPLSPLAPERRGHPSLDYCEWTSAEARREATNAGKHDRVHEIFSSTGRTVRPRKVVPLSPLPFPGRRRDPILPRHAVGAPLRREKEIAQAMDHLARWPGTVRV